MSTKNTPYIILPAEAVWEDLRRRAISQAEKLSRSVVRLTSCDAPCIEYANEILLERTVSVRQLQEELTTGILSGRIGKSRCTSLVWLGICFLLRYSCPVRVLLRS